MLEEDTEEIRWKIYRHSKDIFFFMTLGGCSMFIVGILSLLDPGFDVYAFLPLMVIMFFWAFPPLLIILLIEKQALEKYPFHPPTRFGPLAYPFRSFESAVTMLVAFWDISIFLIGFFLSQSVSLEIEYITAMNITFSPLAVIKSFFSYRMFKKKYFF